MMMKKTLDPQLLAVLTLRQRIAVFMNRHKHDSGTIDDDLTLFAEINRELSADIGLDLPYAPFRALRVAHKHPRLKKCI